ncbi:MAG: DUF2807 domain-containing protein [Oscillospiraceae bacterium]|jgi:hypothetical protein|nr:DUF2807 domain-containing protein [Oscillospiraceae bacterium]
MKTAVRCLALFVTLGLASAILAGCVSVVYGGVGAAGIVRGEGEVITAEFPAEDFTGIEIMASVKVRYSAGECAVEMKLHENLMEYVEVTVRDGVLRVESEKMFTFNSPGEEAVVYVTAPTLDSIVLLGGVEMEGSDALSADSLYMELSGASEADMILDVNSLEINTSGATELDFSGRADSFSSFGSGFCEIRALELKTKRAEINLSGTGEATISCSEELDVTISGGGTVRYNGDPEVNKNIAGIGSVDKIEDADINFNF